MLCISRRCHPQPCHAAAAVPVWLISQLACFDLCQGITWVSSGANGCASAGCRHAICGAQEPLSPETLMRDRPLHEEE